MGLKVPEHYLPFIGTLFVFIATANVLTVLPFYEPPTQLAVEHRRAGAVCIRRGAAFRRRPARLAPLPALIPGADPAHVAVQPHRRVVPARWLSRSVCSAT